MLKLLMSTLSEVDLSRLQLWTLTSLDKHLVKKATPTSPTSPPGQPLATPPITEALSSTAQYLYYLDSSASLPVITRSTDKYPHATLYLLESLHLGKKAEDKKSFVLTNINLTSVPVSWIDHTHLTHVSLHHNQLLKVPVELFQLPHLYRLNISHNCLEALPDILTWNCPRLKEVNVSHNRLQSRPFVILEGRRPAKDPHVNAHPPSNTRQRNVVNAAQAVINLTGHNLYPCIYSLARVNISHNATLEQVGGARRCGL